MHGTTPQQGIPRQRHQGMWILATMLLDRVLACIALHRAAPRRSLSVLSSWKKLPSLPAPGRHDHGMVVLSIGRQAGPAREAVAVFGGHFGHGKSMMAKLDTWLYTVSDHLAPSSCNTSHVGIPPLPPPLK